MSADQPIIPSELHLALIEYATTQCRLLYIEHVFAWREFHIAQILSNDDELTPENLCNIFLQDVLPNIHRYQLESVVKKRLRLLNMHPGFRQLAHGFQYISNNEQQLREKFQLQLGKDFSSAHEIDIDELESANESHTILMNDQNDNYISALLPNINFSKETAALLSAVVSNDSEISMSQLFDPITIAQRLRRAKEIFEDTASLNPYLSNMETLKKRTEILVSLKKGICKSVSMRNF